MLGDRKHALMLDAGGSAASVTASAGERGDHDGIMRDTTKGRVELPVHRISERRFSIRPPTDLGREVRVLHVDIRYRARV